MHARLFEKLEAQLSQTLESIRFLDEKRENHGRFGAETRAAMVEESEDLDGLLNLDLEDPRDIFTQQADHKLSELVNQVQHLSSLLDTMPLENSVLRKLHFQSIFRREHDVVDPEDKTFQWIFDISHETETTDQVVKDDLILDDLITSYSSADEAINRRNTSTSLMRFLREEGQTFLITGKAGCGKSTFMKYVAHHKQTDANVKIWAGATKLLVVRLFFWQSDDHFQMSIEGFWRSVLFQILSQCPELIGQVFPNGQSASENVSNAVEFAKPELESAFSRLLAVASPERYSFIFFVDGLDEHQGDNLSHESMANMLASWSSRPNMKVVCSCRPYTVFLDTFRDTGVIVEFHKLTWSDVSNFAESKFRSALSKSRMLDAQRNCIALVEEITTRAEGVFIWATIAVRALVNQALDHDGEEEALRLRLQQCPDSLDDLFKQMLKRIDESDRIQQRSNMVLWLAVHNPFESPLNALIYSWLDELNWLKGSKSQRGLLPGNSAQQAYSEGEISRRKDRVETLLHQVTKGLLEIISTKDHVQYLEYRVDLYHRSVRDFLRDEWRHGRRISPFSSPNEELAAFCCLRSLEAKGIAQQCQLIIPDNGDGNKNLTESLVTNLRRLFDYTFMWLATCSKRGTPPPTNYLLDFEGALVHAQSICAPFLLGTMLINGQASWRYHSQDTEHPCAYLHWAAYWHLGDFVRTKCLPEASDRAIDSSDLRILLSSSVAGDADTTRFLLSCGHRPQDRIRITNHRLYSPFDERDVSAKDLDKMTYTPAPAWKQAYSDVQYRFNGPKQSTIVWAAFLRDLANNVRSFCWKKLASESWPPYLDGDWVERLAHVAEAHLEAGADPSAVFLVLVVDRVEPIEVDLYQMLDLVKPENLESLAALLSTPRRRSASWLTSLWSGGGAAQTPSAVERAAVTRLLLNSEWRILGVRFEDGEELVGSFKVRVF